jgi:hypothetical protein
MTVLRHSEIRAPAAEPCPFCGCGTALAAHRRPSHARPTRAAFRHFPPPTYKGGWPRSGYVPLDAPPIDWSQRAAIAAAFGRIDIEQPRDERATIGGQEVPNARLGDAA